MLGYLGPPRPLERLVLDPPWSLRRQSYEPRLQSHGVINADGFGVGWYVPDVRPEPACYRSDRPIWTDGSFASLAGTICSPAVVASVRSATPPAPSDVSGAHPFAAGPWLFAHNGIVFDFRGGVGTRLRRAVTDRREPGIVGASDSEVLFALVLDALDAGAGSATALADVVARVVAEAGGRLNLLLTDGRHLAATCWGEDLHVLARERADGCQRVVASEPFDDEPDWRPVPDRSLVTITADDLTVVALP